MISRSTVRFRSKDIQKAYDDFAEAFNMHQEVTESYDYTANIVRNTPKSARRSWKDDQTEMNRQRQEIAALKRMLKAACVLAGIDNPLVLRKKSVKALNFGGVPRPFEKKPRPLSVEAKSR